MNRFEITLKKGRTELYKNTIKASSHEEAQEWGKRQAKEMKEPDAAVVVMTAQE